MSNFYDYFMHHLILSLQHLSPGKVESDFFEASGISTDMAAQNGLSSQDVADAMIYIIGTKPHVNVTELTLVHEDDYH